MSTPTVDTDGAAEMCIRITETGIFLGAPSDGALRAPNTMSLAEEYQVKLEARVSEYGNIVTQPLTNNPPVVGSVLASSTVLDRASDPQGLYTA